ncbi:hypothetical protein G6F32_015352 [Rhizopus arrhizus]|nr:hypothetical protein G6F32_015352 [Rhizopus arrhizus]
MACAARFPAPCWTRVGCPPAESVSCRSICRLRRYIACAGNRAILPPAALAPRSRRKQRFLLHAATLAEIAIQPCSDLSPGANLGWPLSEKRNHAGVLPCPFSRYIRDRSIPVLNRLRHLMWCMAAGSNTGCCRPGIRCCIIKG